MSRESSCCCSRPCRCSRAFARGRANVRTTTERTAMAWNPAQYLRFADDRRRPAIDLVARIAIDAPRTIVDLGCGAGNVTRLLGERWPQARVVGIDSSRSMLESARAATKDDPRFEWIEADVASWRPRE